ncbi:MAG: glycosyltransferase family 2 protein [Candidatus Poribacteria bacterium]
MSAEKINLVSIVSPVYRGENFVDVLCREIIAAFEPLQLNVEIILVDDGSPDRSWERIVELSKQDSRIRGLQLSRNFGQHYAITAGIDHAQGDWVGVIDCDLEDHPKYFKKLIEKMNEGYNVVFARRLNKKHNLIKQMLSRLFVMTFNFMTGLHHDSAVGTFSIMDRKVADAFRQYRESLRTYTLLVYHLGFDIGFCDIEHGRRYEGKSSYTLKKLLSLTLHTTLVYTERPLRAVSLLGLVMSLLAFLYATYAAAAYFFYGDRLVGWSSLIASIYLTAGIITFSIGINGIYLGKCFLEGLKRPLYHIKNHV